MRHALKRTLSVILALIMVFGGAPFGALTGLTEWLGGLTASAAHTWVVGDIGTFGSYPQTRVTDSTLLTVLNAQTLTWVSYGYYSGTGSYGTMTQSDYMKYANVTYGGNKYRAVKFTSYRPYWTCYSSSASNTYQDDNGYSTNTTYWFKYEPLQWRVLEPSTGLVLCESIIDSQAYSNTIYYKSSTGEYYNNAACTVYANDYATSSVRTWLNGLFFQMAFTSSEQSGITTTTLDNSAWQGYSQYDSASTNDKLFLLSNSESINTAYGFSSSYSTNDPARYAQGSDYAKCQGLYTYNSAGEYYGNSNWWLRSPGYGSSGASYVHYYGGYVSHRNVNLTYIGVRPAFRISNLSSLKAISVTGISLSEGSLSLIAGETAPLAATIGPADATDKSVAWTSSDESVAIVNSTGLVTAKSAGTATITVTANDTTNGTIIDTCAVIVYNVESITAASMPTVTQYNYKQAFDITGLTLAATYSDQSTQIITDISKMTVTGYNAKKTGTQTLTVEYEGCQTSIKVTVKLAWWQWLIKILLFGWIWY